MRNSSRLNIILILFLLIFCSVNIHAADFSSQPDESNNVTEQQKENNFATASPFIGHSESATESSWSMREGQHIKQTVQTQITEANDSSEESVWDKLQWGMVAGGFLSGNLNSNEMVRRQTNACLSVDFGCLITLDKNNICYGKAECGYGEGLDGQIATFAGFCDEMEPDERLRLTEFWFEHHFENKWRLRFGQVDLTTDFDCNDYANCGFEQFCSSGFVNNLALDVPDNTFGGMLWKDLGDSISLGAGYQSTNEWNDVFSHGFGIVELDIHTKWNELQGNWRFYAWLNNFVDYEESNIGWGFSHNQEITKKVGVWSRLGIQNEDVADFKSHYSIGLEFHHCIPNNDDDLFGIAYGVTSLASSYQNADEYATAKENFIETYYRHQLNSYSNISPYLQWVENPLGDENAQSVFVLGLRGVLSL